MVSGLGFRTMAAEGARHVLGWKSPNFLYAAALDQRQKLMLRILGYSFQKPRVEPGRHFLMENIAHAGHKNGGRPFGQLVKTFEVKEQLPRPGAVFNRHPIIQSSQSQPSIL